MTSMNEPEGLTAVLLQIATLTEKLAALEHRHASDTRQAREHITALTRVIDQVKATVAGQAQAIAVLDGLDTQVSELAARLADLAPAEGAGSRLTAYQPPAAPQPWKPDEPALDQVIARLRAWVDQVYRPGYGHLSASLADCWDQHPLCLYILDWLSELWSVLYLAPDRTQGTLAAQAEWHTRLLTAAADQLARETRGCGHAAARWRTPARTGTRP